jgi:hypothetical protein
MEHFFGVGRRDQTGVCTGVFSQAILAFAAGALFCEQTPDPTPLHISPPPQRPLLGPFPRYKDWSFLRDPANRFDHYDRLKFLPLNQVGQITSRWVPLIEDPIRQISTSPPLGLPWKVQVPPERKLAAVAKVSSINCM